MRFRPWNGVFLSEEYLGSVEKAEAITQQLLQVREYSASGGTLVRVHLCYMHAGYRSNAVCIMCAGRCAAHTLLPALPLARCAGLWPAQRHATGGDCSAKRGGAAAGGGDAESRAGGQQCGRLGFLCISLCTLYLISTSLSFSSFQVNALVVIAYSTFYYFSSGIARACMQHQHWLQIHLAPPATELPARFSVHPLNDGPTVASHVGSPFFSAVHDYRLHSSQERGQCKVE